MKNTDFGKLHGTKRLGLHHIALEPGEKLAFHSHGTSVEDFAYVLKGHPKSSLTGAIVELSPRFAVGFGRGMSESEFIFNDTNEIVELFCAWKKRTGDSPSAALVVDASILPLGKLIQYRDDAETFGHGQKLSELTGLRHLGVWEETLMPERRSSFPHAHLVQEEFAYIV
ncbi:MAG: hypothetical protein V4692_15720, partial [Bdellovibrionota bacterium]